MEGVLRRRDPNSLPVLMWAANQTKSPKKGSEICLQEIITKLETELEKKDEEGKRTVRSLQQKHLSVKVEVVEIMDSIYLINIFLVLEEMVIRCRKLIIFECIFYVLT